MEENETFNSANPGADFGIDASMLRPKVTSFHADDDTEDDFNDEALEDDAEETLEGHFKRGDIDRLIKSNRKVLVQNGKHVKLPHPKEILDAMKNILGDYCKEIHVLLGNAEVQEMIDPASGTPTGQYVETFEKYIIIAELHAPEVEGHFFSVGAMVNTQKRMVKIFGGARARACNNGMIFGAESVYVIKQLEEQFYNQFEEPIRKCSERTINMTERFGKEIAKLVQQRYDQEGWEQRIGQITLNIPMKHFGLLKNAQALLRNKDSMYFAWPNSEWKLFSALTHYISMKTNVEEEIDATLTLQKMFNIFAE